MSQFILYPDICKFLDDQQIHADGFFAQIKFRLTQKRPSEIQPPPPARSVQTDSRPGLPQLILPGEAQVLLPR